MAVDLFSENSNISPRISFSRDFCQSDVIPIEQRPLRSPSKKSSLNSSADFDFCIPGGVSTGESFDQASWSADEIFCDGKILPTQIKNRPDPKNRNPVREEPAKQETGLPQLGNPQPAGQTEPDINPNRKPALIRDETTGDDDDVSIPMEEKPNTKSFWGFKRSSSLNCGSGYGRSFCPLALLSRSNSTGSTGNVTSGSQKQKQSTKKQTEQMKCHLSSSNSYQKPPLKKSFGGYSYGGNSGIRVNPVINVVPSGNLFGLGSIFSGSGSGKDKNRKR